jgi:hypothetical protein
LSKKHRIRNNCAESGAGGSLICEAATKSLAAFCCTTTHPSRPNKLVVGHSRQQFAGLLSFATHAPPCYQSRSHRVMECYSGPPAMPGSLLECSTVSTNLASYVDYQFLLPTKIYIGSRLGICARRKSSWRHLVGSVKGVCYSTVACFRKDLFPLFSLRRSLPFALLSKADLYLSH